MNDESKTNMIGLYLVFMLFIYGLIPLYMYFSNFYDNFITSIVYIGCSGGLGGTIYSIRGYYQNLASGTFALNWGWWYLFRPLISVVMGIFTYFFILGGLLVVSTGSAGESGNLMLYGSIAFLAGFSFSRFADKLEEIATAVFSKKN